MLQPTRTSCKVARLISVSMGTVKKRAWNSPTLVTISSGLEIYRFTKKLKGCTSKYVASNGPPWHPFFDALTVWQRQKASWETNWVCVLQFAYFSCRGIVPLPFCSAASDTKNSLILLRPGSATVGAMSGAWLLVVCIQLVYHFAGSYGVLFS